MRIDLVTLFPHDMQAWCRMSIVGRAQRRGLVRIACHDIRNWAGGRHRVVDDRPYGGGPGMVMAAPPVAACVDFCLRQSAAPRLLMPTAQGPRLDQAQLQEWSECRHVILVCGHYEGIDERFVEQYQPQEFSVGDFVVSGGELPALLAVDGMTRLLPGVLGDAESHRSDSFQDGELDHPCYTRPLEFRGMTVPEVLRGGDHQAIAAWRAQQRRLRTRQRRPDLISDDDAKEPRLGP
ncbi:MAG: tRNA (guanosine(37)-N1)-methyltransferase TrmD [Planctomycetota bacterium]|nr:MAG: tRNA (guanosine(37)-N1)-methyltransferase TrmD [Planctomycetota bacterium]